MFLSSKFQLPALAQLVGASLHTPKGGGFGSRSGHMLRLGV